MRLLLCGLVDIQCTRRSMALHAQRVHVRVLTCVTCVSLCVLSQVPKEWPRVHQRVELHISVDLPLALCFAVLSVGALVSGILWSTGSLLRSWKEFKSAEERPAA